MIKIEIVKTESSIKLFNTELSKTYVNLYVDGKYNSDKSFSYFRQLSLDEILNSKSISVEYIKRENFSLYFI